MSTQHHIQNELETQSWASPPVHDERILPEQVFPQPPQRPPHPKRNLWIVITASVLMLALVLSLGIIFIPGLISHPGGQVTPTPTSPSTRLTPTAVPATPTKPATATPGPEITPTPSPVIRYGPQACPAAVSSPAYWNAVIGTNSGERLVESISCANIMGNPSLQALILVRHTDANATLDAYVFTNISSKPGRIFLLPGLVKGDAKISGYNTIMTAEADQHAAPPDLYREFSWSASKNTLVQVAFPGIFPDLTRYQAEADQLAVNQGKDSWKQDPKQVAQQLAIKFLNWKLPLQATILSGGGANDVNATVKIGMNVQGVKTGPNVTVTLSRLEGNTHNLWEAIGMQDGTAVTLTNIEPKSLISSPVKLEGKGDAFENTIGMAYILDHLYTKVGQAILTGPPGIGLGNLPYSAQVSYNTSFKQGPQEGVVEVASTSPIGYAPAVMVKVLLDPQPRVVTGPVSCPIAMQVPGYWETVLGIDSSTASVGTVSCANLKGDPSLQALVPVSYTNGQPGVYYVYDNITNAHPVQIFKLQTKNAKISGASTVITEDIDPNSSVNTGKSADQMIADLYREFRWSGGTGNFVQVAFPGMFPGLTRWQAEDVQTAVAGGQYGWMLDAVKTVQHMFVFSGPNIKLVKGGSSHDLTAVVNVTIPSPEQPNAPRPVTQVTLSRLEGNLNGIWEVTAVGSDWLFIYTPRSGATISSPVTVTGFGPQFEAKIGVVYILDHLNQWIQAGDTSAMAPDGSSPPSKFSLDVNYKSSFQGGAQEGIVELLHTGGTPSDYGLVMVKVLIGA